MTRCCRCNKLLGENRVLMLGADNSVNTLKRDFFVCNKCYKKWENLWKNLGKIKFEDINKFWMELFFEVFIKNVVFPEKVAFT